MRANIIRFRIEIWFYVLENLKASEYLWACIGTLILKRGLVISEYNSDRMSPDLGDIRGSMSGNVKASEQFRAPI